MPSESALAQPPFSFSYRLYVVSLPLRISALQDYGGAHPLVMDALAEMSEAQMQMRLTHPPVRAQARSQGRRGGEQGSLLTIYLQDNPCYPLWQIGDFPQSTFPTQKQKGGS